MSAFPEFKYPEVYPTIAIIANVINDGEGDVPKYEGCDKIYTLLRDLGFLVKEVEDVWPYKGYEEGYLLVHFEESEAGSISAMKLHYQFLANNRGVENSDPEDGEIAGPYCWVATETDYNILRRDVQCKFLSNDVLGAGHLMALEDPVDACKALCDTMGVFPDVDPDCIGGPGSSASSSEEEEQPANKGPSLP